MGFFSKILDKLGLKKDNDAADDAAQAKVLADMAKKEAEARAKMQGSTKPSTPATAAKPSAPAAAPRPAATSAREEAETIASAPPTTAAPKPVSEVDVVQKLEVLAKGKGLNWKTSIADLLALLDLDNSKEARIELARELGCPEEYIGGDYSKMNTWLHKTVLKKIAENGGNIPQELLD